MNKKLVLFRAPVLTQSGYGHHARQIAQWLLSRNDIDVYFQALPWGNTPWLVDRSRCDNLIDKMVVKSIDPKLKNFDVSIQLQLPNEWDPKLARRNIGITAAVETDRCNQKWTDACKAMNVIVVPSEHAKKNIENGTGVQSLIIPEAYTSACVKEPTVTLDDFSTNFNFLLLGQITGSNPFNDRKNIFFTLKWLFEEFKDNEDVGIIIKTNSGRNTLIDQQAVVLMLGQIVGEARKGMYPKLHIIHGDMTDEEIVGLYKHRQVKALVSATRGEGYGLPLLEAAVCGLPVIATNWSGHLDFLKKGKFVSVAYELKDIHQSRLDDNIFMPGMKWAEPSEFDFKQRVSKFYRSSSIPTEWAKDLSSKLVNEYSLETISKRYDVVLDEQLRLL